MMKTLYDKLWESHTVQVDEDGTTMLYIDRHLLHEVTSPQAFEGLRSQGRRPWRGIANLAVADHNVPTGDRAGGIADPVARRQVETLDSNTRLYGLTYFDMNDRRQGIVHVVGPEQGATLPGMTIVCGDSHTSTHGAFGCLAFGIGTSEVEHVLATQTLLDRKAKAMLVHVEGRLGAGVSAKDIALEIIGRIGTAGGTGHAIEFAGPAIRALSMEGRMTVCNMAIEAGARAGMIAVDDTTIGYIKGRPYAPSGADWTRALARWRTLRSDPGAHFDRVVLIDAGGIRPQVTWGTTWTWRRGCRSPTSASTRSSSARAPIRASRTCAPPPPWCAANGVPPASAWPWWCPARGWSRPRPSARDWTACSRMPVSNGASRAARCAWR
jgi:3-isopropylmalate/(R)-2-methylmalate dehydratase large subunit